MEIWEPKPPGSVWATPGLLRDTFTFYLYYLINGTILEKKISWTQNVCFDFLCKFRLYISHSKKVERGMIEKI